MNKQKTSHTISIREATPEDSVVILNFIKELAEFEKALHEVEATVETIKESIFGKSSVTRGLICEHQGSPIGMALWFYNYSTWQAKNGIYLEDLYVTPQSRGLGAGKALLQRLAEIAIENNCGRFEWSVLDWNEPAINIYKSIGAKPLDEWIRYRLSGEELKDFALLTPKL